MDLPQDTLIEIMHRSDINTLIMLCKSNKDMQTICNTKKFWDDHYLLHEMSIHRHSKKYKFKEWMSAYIHSYNSLLLAKYLLTLNNFEFEFNYDYGGTEEILSRLKKMHIKYKLNEKINTPNGIVKLTKEDIETWNPKVYVENDDKYKIKLYINLLYDDEYYDVEYNIASLTYDQMLVFLYPMIESEYFVYQSDYGFNKPNYKEYKKKLKVPFYISKK